MNCDRRIILGVGFDALSLDEAVRRAEDIIKKKKPSYIVTPNPEIVYIAQKDSAAKEALNGADMVLPDGIGIVKAAAILGLDIKERVPGIDFAEKLLFSLAQTGVSLFLLGGRPGVAETAAERLQKRIEGLKIAGTNDGYFKDSDVICKKIRESGAGVVFVCLSAPMQEKWMAQYKMSTGAVLHIGLGGSVDVFAGNVKRAPVIFRKLGFEWLYRILREPWRLKRAKNIPLFMRMVKKSKRENHNA